MATVRKCHSCGEQIVIDKNNFDGVALLEKKYYHTNCLVELAQKRVQAKRHAAYWDFAFEHIDVCEKNAKEALRTQVYQDELNEHLLNHYEVVSIPSSFWSTISELNNGVYRRKKCKPISIETMCGAWKWGQKRLDDIARSNKVNHKGPQDDTQRLKYDLAILIQKVPLYLKEQARRKVIDAERIAQEKERVKINYKNICTASTETDGLDNISDMLDEI